MSRKKPDRIKGEKTLTCSCGRLSYKVGMDIESVTCWHCIFERNFGKEKKSSQNEDLREYNRNDNIGRHPEKNSEIVNLKNSEIKKEKKMTENKDQTVVVTKEKKAKAEKKVTNPVDPVTGKPRRGRPRKNPVTPEGTKN